MRNWILPEYIEDVLPAEAARVEYVRRQCLDLFHVHGYQLVIPPMLEYLESLMTGSGHDLDLATFKVVDQLTGRTMGLRADITPQTARIDAHLLNRQGVTRLCYAGSVLRAQPDGLAQSREPLHVGAELYGHAGIESDIEIQSLMVRALQQAGVEQLHIDFSHVGIFRSIIRNANIETPLELELHLALQGKDQSSISSLTAELDAGSRQALLRLCQLNGGIEILDDALLKLPSYPDITKAIADLRQVALALSAFDISIGFDLAELRGYHYHSGMLFAAYAQGFSGPLALGGRYDEVGLAFGRSRPATGFSLDMRGLLTSLPAQSSKQGILAPYNNDVNLQLMIEQLRAAGEVVVVDLPGHEDYQAELHCNRKLIQQGEVWNVVPMH